MDEDDNFYQFSFVFLIIIFKKIFYFQIFLEFS
jgi:hypothetical protein